MTAEQIPLVRGTGRTVAWLARQVEHVLSEHELSPAQYRLLALLEESPAVASALADKLTVSRPSVTNVVDGLVARGLVERGTDEADRRKVTHLLTEEGRRALHAADRVVEDSLAETFAELEAGSARDVAAGLGALTELLQAKLATWQPAKADR